MDVTDSYTENFLDAQTGKIEFINDMVIGQEEINAMGIEKSWYDFHDDVYRQKAAQWCEENEIEYE